MLKQDNESLSPLVQRLLQLILEQQKRIEELEEKGLRLKRETAEPKIKPSRLEQGKASQEEAGEPRGLRPGPKRSKTPTLEIHHMEIIKAEWASTRGGSHHDTTDPALSRPPSIYSCTRLAVSGGVRIDLNANQHICTASPVRGRVGKQALILVIRLQAVRIAAEEEWDERLAGYMTILIVRPPYQVFDLPLPHADPQLGELTFRGRVPTISPSNDPSSDFTTRMLGVDGDEGVLVPACCGDAQPNNAETKIAVGSSIFACIVFSRK